MDEYHDAKTFSEARSVSLKNINRYDGRGVEVVLKMRVPASKQIFTAMISLKMVSRLRADSLRSINMQNG
jgi:hypothetical protein